MHVLVALAILLPLMSQQTQTVFRTEKGYYIPMIKKCKEGQSYIKSNPREAISLLTDVIDNSKTRKKKEMRLRVEELPG